MIITTGMLWAVPQDVLAFPAVHELIPVTAHVTLLYDVEKTAVEPWIGTYVEGMIVSECWDDRNHALSVILPDNIPFKRPHFHITISWTKESTPHESFHK